MGYCVLIFESVHKVMKAEQILISEGIKNDIIPTPKELSSDCGMSIRFSKTNTDMEKASRVLSAHNVSYKIYEIE